ncbi:hypothetical protein BKA62DRAFT_352187 [Auriculariales sp. MPI-PUGE-AT-0066]|nr:hypothetical protein BKA62DRAFT_352187 [Auriculariales sp. MPI-PUGE-AT-0066]
MFAAPFVDIMRVSIEGVHYSIVEIADIPGCYVSVDITLYNTSAKRWQAMLLAGVMGFSVLSSGDNSLSKTGNNDTVAPRVAWWLVDTLTPAEMQERDAKEAKRLEEWYESLSKQLHRKESNCTTGPGSSKKGWNRVRSLFTWFASHCNDQSVAFAQQLLLCMIAVNLNKLTIAAFGTLRGLWTSVATGAFSAR